MGDFSASNSIRFKLQVACGGHPGASMNVYSKDLTWMPWDDQEQSFKEEPPRPIADDILIAQLRANQEIECECFCEKGIGKEHAKWSPVCTAFYRLLPDITLTKPIIGEDAEFLK